MKRRIQPGQPLDLIHLLACACLWLVACDEGGSSPRQDGVDAAVQADAGPPDAAPDVGPDAGPTCAVAALYAPEDGQAHVFPDDFWTVEDLATATGRRVAVADTPWVGEVAANYQGVFRALDRLDGFGTASPVTVTFSGPVAQPAPGVVVLEALDEAGTSTEIAFEIELLDGGRTLLLDPLRPLSPGTRHRVAIGAGLTDPAGGCVAPAPGFGPEVLVEATFTTQSALDGSQAVAADIAERTFSWQGAPSCRANGAGRTCERRFLASDYRGEDGIIGDPTPKRDYLMPVSMWLPEGRGPWPVVIAGHGLSDSRSFGGGVSQLIGQGVAVVAIDSPFHGQHPAGASANALFLLRDLFAIDLPGRSLDPERLRDNLRTATFDKLQLLALLQQDPDLDGDGSDDVDETRLAYFGLSLGGILASEFLALADGLDAVVLAVPGAGMTRIMRDSDAFGPVVEMFTPPGADETMTARIFQGMQAVIDSGDGVNFAPRVLSDRLVGQVPHLMILMAVGDETVPNSSTAALARALGLPVLAPATLRWPGVTVVSADPLSGNLDDGHTAGLFQHKLVTVGRTAEPASHNNVVGSVEGLGQIRRFFATWLAGESVEIPKP